MLRLIRNHRRAAHGEVAGYEGLNIAPVPLDHANIPQADIGAHARAAWDRALSLGERHGRRRGQAIGCSLASRSRPRHGSPALWRLHSCKPTLACRHQRLSP